MAESWGGVSNYQQVWFSYGVSGISASSTHATVSISAYLRINPGGAAVGTWAQSWWGHWGSGSQNVSINKGSTAGTADFLIASGSYSIALTDSVQSVGFGAQGVSYLGTVSHTVYVSVPARYAVTPSSLVVTRASDAQHTLSWTRNSTYTNVIVQRRVDDGAWVEIARPGSNPASYVDTTTVANRKYRWRVAGVGGSGQSAGWAESGDVFTTPAAPSSVVAEKVGSDISVTVSGLPLWATAYDVYDNDALVGADVVSFPWVHVAPNPAVTHTYKVKSKRGVLVSGFSGVSNTVQLLTAPNAPTGLAPTGANVLVGDVELSWTHNPVDTTAQTVYELRYRPAGGAWATVSGTTASSRTMSFVVGGFEWQVRTKGDHPAWSAWSAVAAFTVVNAPGAAIVGPVSPLTVPEVNVVWTYSQAQGLPQSAWRVELLDELGALVESREGTGSVTSVLLGTRLVTGVTRTVRVRVAAGSIWSGWTAQIFSTVFVPPAGPVVGAVWDELVGSMGLSVGEGRGPNIPPVTNLFTNPSFEGATSPGLTGGTISTDWASHGTKSLRVGAGETATVTVASPSTVAVVAKDAGQTLTGTTVATSVEAGETLRVQATGTVTFGPGYWDQLTVVAGNYDGPVFTAGERVRVGGSLMVTEWDGADNASRVTATMVPATVAVTVERSVDGGATWEPVLVQATIDQMERLNFSDWESLSYGETLYRVTAITAAGAEAPTVVSAEAFSEAVWLGGGESFAETAKILYQPTVSVDFERARAVEWYDGRPYGVAYAGEELRRVIDVSATLLEGDTENVSLEQLMQVAQAAAPLHLYRDPRIGRVYGSLGPVRSTRRTRKGLWTTSFKLEEASR